MSVTLSRKTTAPMTGMNLSLKDRLWGRLQELQKAERENNGVLECETEKDCLGQAVAWLKKREADLRDAQVEIVPLVIAWGDYMAGELYNSQDSFMWQLRKAGYRTVFTGKGLGEYPEFREIYTKKLKEALS